MSILVVVVKPPPDGLREKLARFARLKKRIFLKKNASRTHSSSSDVSSVTASTVNCPKPPRHSGGTAGTSICRNFRKSVTALTLAGRSVPADDTCVSVWSISTIQTTKSFAAFIGLCCDPSARCRSARLSTTQVIAKIMNATSPSTSSGLNCSKSAPSHRGQSRPFL